VAFSADGKRIAAAGNLQDNSRVVKMWDALTGAELLSWKAAGNPMPFGGLALSRDGGLVAATGASAKHVHVLDGAGASLFTLSHQWAVGPLCFAPDGRRIASVGGGGEIKIWDGRTGQELLTLRGHSATRFLAFCPDGNRLVGLGGPAFGLAANPLRIWDATPLPPDRDAK
jgi:WD40 repeat protein